MQAASLSATRFLASSPASFAVETDVTAIQTSASMLERASDGFECGFDIGQQVFDVLDSDRDPDESRRDAETGPGFDRHGGVGHRFGMGDEGFDSAERAKLRAVLQELGQQQAGGINLEAERRRVQEAYRLSVSAISRVYQVRDAVRDSTATVRAYADSVLGEERLLMGGMRAMLTTLAGVDGKKVMVYAGAQLPVEPGLDMFQWLETLFASRVESNDGLPGGKPHNVEDTPFNIGNGERGTRNLLTDLEQVATDANANGVTMYMIDGADATRGSFATADTIERADPIREFVDMTNNMGSLSAIAHSTGGIALGRSNTFDAALDTVLRDLSTYSASATS